MNHLGWTTAAIAVALSLGCSSGKPGGSSCVPGASDACACQGGLVGAQTCQADGTFAACACPGTTSGGSTASGNTSSASTATGASSGNATTGSSGDTSSGTTGSSTATTGASSTRSTAASSSSTSSAGSSGASGCSASLPPRVLATIDSFQGQIWDVTDPASAQGLIGSADLLSDIPTAISETSLPGDDEILVLLDTAGLVAFDSSGSYLGQIQVPVTSGNFQGGTGLAYVPQPCGAPPVVVVCGAEVTAFEYAGRSAFSANGIAYPTALYTADAYYGACAPGPSDTFFATGTSSVGWFDVSTGTPHGAGGLDAGLGFFAQSQGSVNGVAVDPANEVLLVGDDGSGNGFAALFNATGICEQARSGGACTLVCNGGCAAGDPTLTGIPLQSAAAFNGVFLATASTANPSAMNTILQLDPANALAAGTYLVGPRGTDFYGLFAAPQTP